MFWIFVWLIWLALPLTLILVLCSWSANNFQKRLTKIDLKSKPKYGPSKPGSGTRRSLPKHSSPRTPKYTYRPVYYYEKPVNAPRIESYAPDIRVKPKRSRSPSKKKPIVKSIAPREPSNQLSEKGQAGLSYHYYFDLLKQHGYVKSVSEYQTGDFYKKFTKSIKKQLTKETEME